MSEMGDIFKEYKHKTRERRDKRLPIRTKEICALVHDGFSVERMTDYQFRINNHIYLYPIHNRYHDIKTNKRGGYGNIKTLMQRLFK